MITKVRLLKTLKAGSNLWLEGTVFPSKQFPAIPIEILSEIRNKAGTVEVLESKNPPPAPVVEWMDEFGGTSSSFMKTSNEITPLLEEEKIFEAEVEGLPQEEESKAPEKSEEIEKPKLKRTNKTKPKLVLKVKK